MANQTQIEWRELEDGILEGARGNYDFVISVMDDDGVALDIFDAGNRNNDDAYIESFQVESIDDAKLQAEEYV